MAKLSAKRQQAIYNAVDDEIMTLRITLQRCASLSAALDTMIAQAGERAASAAVRAATGEGE